MKPGEDMGFYLGDNSSDLCEREDENESNHRTGYRYSLISIKSVNEI